MGKFRRTGIRTFTKISTGTVLPTWVRAVPVALAAVLFLLVSAAIFSDNTVEVRNADQTRDELDRIAGSINTDELRDIYEAAVSGTVPPDVVEGGVTDPAVATTALPGTEQALTPPVAPAPDQASDGAAPTPVTGSVEVQLLDRAGNVVSVEESAIAVARAATTALFTGRFDTVPLATGVTPPVLPRIWEDPYVGEPAVDAIGDSVVSIAFVVDPDRAGPALPREIVTSVEVVAAGAWVWLGV